MRFYIPQVNDIYKITKAAQLRIPITTGYKNRKTLDAILGGYRIHESRCQGMNFPMVLPSSLTWNQAYKLRNNIDLSAHERMRYRQKFETICGPKTAAPVVPARHYIIDFIPYSVLATFPKDTIFRIVRLHPGRSYRELSFIDLEFALPAHGTSGVGKLAIPNKVFSLSLPVDEINDNVALDFIPVRTATIFDKISKPDADEWVMRLTRGKKVVGKLRNCSSNSKVCFTRTCDALKKVTFPEEGTLIYEVKVQGKHLIRTGNSFPFKLQEHWHMLVEVKDATLNGWYQPRELLDRAMPK
jgi:hypothetical protein